MDRLETATHRATYYLHTLKELGEHAYLDALGSDSIWLRHQEEIRRDEECRWLENRDGRPPLGSWEEHFSYLEALIEQDVDALAKDRRYARIWFSLLGSASSAVAGSLTMIAINDDIHRMPYLAFASCLAYYSKRCWDMVRYSRF